MVARQKGVNLLVLALSWLHMKCPKKCPSCLAPGRPLSKKQWGVVQRLESFLCSLEEVGDVGPAEMGRSAAKNEGLDVLLHDLQVQAAQLLTTSYTARPAGVLPEVSFLPDVPDGDGGVVVRKDFQRYPCDGQRY